MAVKRREYTARAQSNYQKTLESISIFYRKTEMKPIKDFVRKMKLSHKAIYELGLEKLKFPTMNKPREEAIQELLSINRTVTQLKKKNDQLEKRLLKLERARAI